MTLPEIVSDQLRQSLAACGGVLGTSDVASRLGVSRERARQLAQHEAFPQPITYVTLNGGRQPLWLGAEIDQWARRRRERLKKRQQRSTRPERMRGPRT